MKNQGCCTVNWRPLRNPARIDDVKNTNNYQKNILNIPPILKNYIPMTTPSTIDQEQIEKQIFGHGFDL